MMATDRIEGTGTERPHAAQGPTVIVGLGATGLSLARFLAARDEAFEVVDSRASPPGLAALRRIDAHAEVHLGALDGEWLAGAGRLLLSPGVARAEPAVARAMAAGVPVLGDIELFARHARAPVVAVTGSNGKSTVTTLLGEMAARAGRRAGVGGNLGTPALDLLAGDTPELYVLELSSFQLESTDSLDAAAAVVLNLSPDHLDRYPDLAAYREAKRRVYAGGGVMVVNRDDPQVASMVTPGRRVIGFTLGAPGPGDYGLVTRGGRDWLAREDEPLLPVAELALAGRHNAANALAALALGEAVGLEGRPMRATLRDFRGLAHRCQWVASRDGVDWYDDSKGTNVGATLAALHGLEVPGRVVLIAGGEGKGADFAPLGPALVERGRAVVLIGRDAPLIEQAVAGALPVLHAADMRQAVGLARAAARAGDAVLLSPACASFDMYADYRARGEDFVHRVREVLA